jgi:hypothetical protein
MFILRSKVARFFKCSLNPVITFFSPSYYNAKPKLKIWTTEIKSALRIKRAKYGIWKDNGKPMPPFPI